MVVHTCTELVPLDIGLIPIQRSNAPPRGNFPHQRLCMVPMAIFRDPGKWLASTGVERLVRNEEVIPWPSTMPWFLLVSLKQLPSVQRRTGIGT
jgi:hypothetical protein